MNIHKKLFLSLIIIVWPCMATSAREEVIAMCYGPGLYGRKTASGQRLGRETLGVAHRTLPLGSVLLIKANGKEIPAKVIDRGPYSNSHGEKLDLTEATVRSLGFSNCSQFGFRRVSIERNNFNNISKKASTNSNSNESELADESQKQ